MEAGGNSSYGGGYQSYNQGYGSQQKQCYSCGGYGHMSRE